MDISFDVYSGEILGIAGVSGETARRSCWRLSRGLQGTAENSSITFYGDDAKMQLIGMTPRKIRGQRAFTSPLCRRIGWAWAWWVPWA